MNGMDDQLIQETRAAFQEKFSGDYVMVKSPGRINVIGEHTDYNEGFVLPGAIDKSIYVAAQKRHDNNIELFSLEFTEEHKTSVGDLTPPSHAWTDYVLGVVDQFKIRGLNIGGFNMVVNGNVPIGAGMSSSAAVECAVTMTLSIIFDVTLERQDIVDIAQMSEHQYAKVMCGVMDMFASVFGKRDHVIKLDCRSLKYEYVPLVLDGYQLVLFNTNVKHSLASSAYNKRREECAQGVKWVAEQVKNVRSLRDVSLTMLDQFVLPKDKLIYRRCRFVVEESLRLLDACEDLKRNDLASMGEKMFETHEGLSRDYEVSCKELDVLVDIVKDNPAVLGARMMGGGFGGCTINLIENASTEAIIKEVQEKYERETGLKTDHYIVRLGDGTSVISS
jgi:galactokinase